MNPAEQQSAPGAAAIPAATAAANAAPPVAASKASDSVSEAAAETSVVAAHTSAASDEAPATTPPPAPLDNPAEQQPAPAAAAEPAATPAATAAPTPREEPALAELARIRHSIDNLDAALIHILAERFRYTQRVGRLKADANLPASDPAREAEQVARLRALAHDADLDPEFAEKFLGFVVAEVIRHHERIKAEQV